MSIQAVNNAMSAMMAQQNRLDGVAERVARWRATDSARGPAPQDLVRDVIEAQLALRTFEVNAAVRRAADRLTGLLLDVMA
ncbi:MAG: flagellar hook protein FlgE [Candidatus Latescibacteria bacterium]|nr:flagellar hook protein FlgE [Candidatus Latescibacterota bacterium]